MERYRETFNDGILKYGISKTERTANRKNTKKVFNEIGKLKYRVLSARDSDYLACGALGSSLDLKVKTPMPPSLRTKILSDYKVVLNNEEYEVIKGDRDKFYLYFYLSRVGVNSNE
jgi:hypothetical protein